jgi:hypothetical protein
MWQVTIVCSSCAEESEVVVEDIDAVEREACECGYSYVVLAIAGFEPLLAAKGELIELRRRDNVSLAA